MHDVLVIGGGVAGLQAAVFTAKAGLETVVLDDGNPLVSNTDKIQNLLTEERIAGDEIIESGRERVMEFGGNIEKATVTRLDREDTPGPFTVTTESDDSYRSETVIIATANEFDMLTPLDDEIEYVDGPKGEFTMEKHIQTDNANQASDNIYVAGLANTWEYQTAVAIGDGAKAAINLVSDRNEEAYIDHDW